MFFPQETEILTDNLGQHVLKNSELLFDTRDLRTLANLQESMVGILNKLSISMCLLTFRRLCFKRPRPFFGFLPSSNFSPLTAPQFSTGWRNAGKVLCSNLKNNPRLVTVSLSGKPVLDHCHKWLLLCYNSCSVEISHIYI